MDPETDELRVTLSKSWTLMLLAVLDAEVLEVLVAEALDDLVTEVLDDLVA